MTRTCPECDDPMTAELLRPDDTPVYMLICPCGHSEPVPADIESITPDWVKSYTEKIGE